MSIVRGTTIRASMMVALAAAIHGGPLNGQDAPDSVVAEVGDVEAERSVVEGVDYRIYDRRGEPTSLLAVVGSSAAGDVLLIGEEHDDMVGHRLEEMILRTVLDEVGTAASGRRVVLSLEMFERDVQYILDEYLAGLISEEHFLRSSRPWDHYEDRYRPLVELAKDRAIQVVAANAPRRYVSRVTSEGPESLTALSDEALRFLPPLPYPGPSDVYRAQWDSIMARAMDDAGADEGREYAVNPNAVYAQALWDAAMGHAITRALVRNLDGFVVHVAGSFHVAGGTGIPERIADYRPGTEVTTVIMTNADDIDAWTQEEHGTLGDFVILTRRPEGEGP